MEYITGMFALNIPCALGTTGDWHRSSLPWNKVEVRDSNKSVLKDLGIEKGKYIEELGTLQNVADHIRACADLLDEGRYSLASGMRLDYFDNDKDISEILFDYVYRLKAVKNEHDWQDISRVMEKDYMLRWLKFMKEKEETA